VTREGGIPTVILDTNCIVSALLFRAGRMSWLREGWKTGVFVPLACPTTRNELVRVLDYPKFRLSSDEKNVLLSEVEPFLRMVETPRPGRTLPGLTDPDNAVFIDLARNAAVQALVSGDAHILACAGWIDIPIMNPATFRDWLAVRTL
jgi:predicted nucleic acid-binding protein